MIKIESKCPYCNGEVKDVEEYLEPTSNIMFTNLFLRCYCNQCNKFFYIKQEALIVREFVEIIK